METTVTLTLHEYNRLMDTAENFNQRVVEEARSLVEGRERIYQKQYNEKVRQTLLWSSVQQECNKIPKWIRKLFNAKY